MYFIQCTGITPVENLQLKFNVTSSSWLTWFPPVFSSENTQISYHIYIENQHSQLLYSDITEDTSYELYNLTVCDIYTATVIVYSGEYSSSNVTIQREYNRGTFLFKAHLTYLLLQITMLLLSYQIMTSSLINIIILLIYNFNLK